MVGACGVLSCSNRFQSSSFVVLYELGHWRMNWRCSGVAKCCHWIGHDGSGPIISRFRASCRRVSMLWHAEGSRPWPVLVLLSSGVCRYGDYDGFVFFVVFCAFDSVSSVWCTGAQQKPISCLSMGSTDDFNTAPPKGVYRTWLEPRFPRRTEMLMGHLVQIECIPLWTSSGRYLLICAARWPPWHISISLPERIQKSLIPLFCLASLRCMTLI